jgi:hypothetical protein
MRREERFIAHHPRRPSPFYNLRLEEGEKKGGGDGGNNNTATTSLL